MNDPRCRLIYLAQNPQLSRPLLLTFLKEDRTLEPLFSASIKDLVNKYQLSTTKAQTLHRYIKDKDNFDRLLTRLSRFKIWTILDPDFPLVLTLIPDPPVVLYGLGQTCLIDQMPSLAVVGTRHPSKLAKKHMYQLLKPLVDKDWVLVSGMAYGIDGYAHRLADYYGGKTIAVLAGGLEYPYPPGHLNLYHRLIENQLVISEYPPFDKPKRYQFPERNRLISGLTFATLVIEAKHKSGSLITADQALEQGKDVFAVPGAISQSQSQGCHELIQNGAKLVQNTHDILQEWELFRRKWCRMMLESNQNPAMG
ncbi:DNA-processing protein DprA [Amphibacillus cookii]|uniref:DNA-processing protein DprA n=1 Tax=Amphibacillus cookii TaxID=767787 RepID=UPI0019580E51|nr:DNA-processing protein DprA [Amphibacillus cookii]MBM7540559.1 DNA processing protein [Amphibacillus cookii]